MKRSTRLVAVVAAGLSLAACTGRSPRSVQIEPQPARSQPGVDDGTAGRRPPGPGDVTNPGSGDTPISVNVDLTKQYLTSKVANLDLNNLTYKFAYLTKTQSDKILFDAAGKATLTFASLPANQAGTVSLEILEGTTVKLRGTADNVTLKVGQANKIPLELKPVDAGGSGGGGGGGGTTTDLVLEVSLGTSGGGQPTPAPTSGPSPAPSDPIASWDGLSNQGNSRWKIVPVN